MFSEEFWSLVEEANDLGYIGVQKHPDYPLWIYNYTNQCMFDGYWNEATIQCRGLIVDENKNVVALPFKKFFSDNQLQSLGYKIPLDMSFEVYDKADGSLGILYQIPSGEFAIATRGSFTSDQAMEANKIFYEKGYNEYDFNHNWTYLFEIIYPGNRIVIDYGKTRDLFLLAIIDKATGIDIPLPNQNEVPFPIIKKYDGIKDFSKILDNFKDIPGTEFEGFVVKFESGFRVKLKTENYKLLHKIFTGMSERRIWEVLSEGGDLKEILEVCPDEFHRWAKQVEVDLRMSYGGTEGVSRLLYQSALEHIGDEPDLKIRRKKFAEYILKCDNLTLRSVAFQMYSGGDYSDIIWKSLRPSGSKTFKNEGDVE